MGDKLLPILNAGLERVGKWADRMSAWANRNPAAARTLAMLVAAIGALLATLGSLAVVLGVVWGPLARGFLLLGKLGPVLRLAGGMFGWLFRIVMVAVTGIAGVLGLPVWAVVAIVAAIGVAAYAIYRYWDKIKAGAGAAWTFVKQAFTAGMAWFLGLNARFVSIGVNLVRGIIGGIGSMFGALKAKIMALGQGAVGWFKGVLGIHSPSRVFAGLGGHMMTGLSLGLDRGADGPLRRIRQVAGRLTGAMAAGSLATAAAAAPVARSAPFMGVGSTPRAAPAAAGPRHFHFTINGAAGQSIKDLADEVIRRLKEAEAVADRRSYQDDD